MWEDGEQCGRRHLLLFWHGAKLEIGIPISNVTLELLIGGLEACVSFPADSDILV
jgi:hypothetical protein